MLLDRSTLDLTKPMLNYQIKFIDFVGRMDLVENFKSFLGDLESRLKDLEDLRRANTEAVT